MLAMALHLEARQGLTTNGIDAIEDRFYELNRHATDAMMAKGRDS